MLKPRKRVTRRELKRDPLMEALYRLRRWWLGHKKQVYRYGGIGLIVVALAVFVVLSRTKLDKDAAVVVGQAFVEYGQGNYNAVVAILSAHVDEYSGLESFGNGLYILARSELIVGDTTRAEEYYRRYLDDYGNDPLIKAGALAGLGIIAEWRTHYRDAAGLFKKASQSAPTASLKQQFAIYAGRNYILSAQPGEALEILQPILGEGELDFQTRSEIQALVSSAEAL